MGKSDKSPAEAALKAHLDEEMRNAKQEFPHDPARLERFREPRGNEKAESFSSTESGRTTMELIDRFLRGRRARAAGLAFAAAAIVLAIVLIDDPGSVTDRRYDRWKDPNRGSEDAMPSECRLLKGGTLQLVDVEKRTELTGRIQSVNRPELGVDYPLTLIGKDAEGVIATFRGKVQFGPSNAVFNGQLELSGFFTNMLTNVVYLQKP